MDELRQAREAIDRIDAELARLFEARMAAAAEIAACKQVRGLPIRDPEREREVLERNAARLEDPALRLHFRVWLEALMAQSRDYQAALIDPDGPERLTVRSAEGPCPVYLKRGGLHEAGELLRLDRRVLIVTDEGVPRQYAETLAAQCRAARVHTVPQGEAAKSPAVLTQLLESMLNFGLSRGDCAAAVGGGVVGDLTGLAAALYLRGVDWYNLPTTTLSMTDSAIGGKTAVNLGGVKNAVGAFWPARAVLLDPALLDTLPRRHWANGLAEAVKMGLTHDAALFARFEDPAGPGPVEEIIAACLRIKRSVVEADEREAGPRRVLNFGHTLGHGIEAAAEGALLHGECVGLGMLPMCAPALRPRLATVLERLGLQTYVNFELDVNKAMEAIAHDKKSTGDGIEIVTVPEAGRFEFRRASLPELRALLLTLQREC